MLPHKTDRSLICPGCHKPHRTLGSLLQCHPAELRIITDKLDDRRISTTKYNLVSILSGQCPAWVDVTLGRRSATNRAGRRKATR